LTSRYERTGSYTSHVSVLEIEVRSLEALKLAAADCGLTFCEGQTKYRWYGHFMGDSPMPDGLTVADLGKCDHALCIMPDNGRAYQIGVAKVGDAYQLRYDFWQGGFGLEKASGPGCQKLLQRYGYWQARLVAEQAGYDWEEENLADGTIKLTVNVPDQQQIGAW
jgi:hypothetical protein